tara:strand:- start:143 stop:313 length:171 start_codon:yes stop_codon:yes gene_type:complete
MTSVLRFPKMLMIPGRKSGILTMKAYRLLTGVDDAAFCHRITKALNLGWSLHGRRS